LAGTPFAKTKIESDTVAGLSRPESVNPPGFEGGVVTGGVEPEDEEPEFSDEDPEFPEEVPEFPEEEPELPDDPEPEEEDPEPEFEPDPEWFDEDPELLLPR
jgi:hypothetical protein